MPRSEPLPAASLLRWQALARILPFALYIAFLALTPIVARAFPQWDARWLYAVQVGAVLAGLTFFAREYAELARPPRLLRRDWLLAAVAGVAVFLLWIHLDAPWATLGEAAGFDPRRGDGAIDWPLAAARLFGAVAVVPVMEELFWRSFVLRWVDRGDFMSLAPRAASLRALAVSSLLFGLEHHLWLAGVLAGLAYGALYRRSGSLWPPIAAHAVTNLLLGLWVLRGGHWHFW
jgi:hypothetical protein